MDESRTSVDVLRLMVKGAYDLQALRMQSGLRLCANFRAKLKDSGEEDEEEEGDELSEKAQRIIDVLKQSYSRLTDGVAKNRSLPKEQGFEGDELISDYSELVLIDQYVRLEQQERRQFGQMTSVLERIPIYVHYLADEKGIGPAMAGVLIAYLDPHKAGYVSSFWRYAGLDVGSDNRGRSRRAEHLVERQYMDKEGNEKTRLGVTYNPFLKTKIAGVLGGSFLRSGSRWREVYDQYKHRIMTDPEREKVTTAEWKKRHKAGDDTTKLWPPKRVHAAANRYMIKMFLAELWTKWRTLEGLPVTLPYNEARRGYGHGEAA